MELLVKFVFASLLMFHGWVHLLGFIKAFNLANVPQLRKKVIKPFGVLWLLAGLLFIYLALAFLVNEDWYLDAFAYVILSQFLIFMFWQDAKAASIVNLLILSVALVQYAGADFENTYEQDVVSNLKEVKVEEVNITEDDLSHLPLPVSRYLKYVGVIGTPKVKTMKVIFHGKMRREAGGWFSFKSSQYNFFTDRPARLFFMKARLSGLPAVGYHSYQGGDARMQIKLMSLFPVVDIKNEELFKAETVTLFNDLCLLAPASLIDRRISWKAINDSTAEAQFTNQDVRISATLHFNSDHQLINFVSDDRYDLSNSETKQYRFSTPVSTYKNINGFNLPSYGETIWHYPEGKFVYGQFNLQSVEYNVTKLQ